MILPPDSDPRESSQCPATLTHDLRIVQCDKLTDHVGQHEGHYEEEDSTTRFIWNREQENWMRGLPEYWQQSWQHETHGYDASHPDLGKNINVHVAGTMNIDPEVLADSIREIGQSKGRKTQIACTNILDRMGYIFGKETKDALEELFRQEGWMQ